MNTTGLNLLIVVTYLLLGTLGIALIVGWVLNRLESQTPPARPARGVPEADAALSGRKERATRRNPAP